MLQNAERDGRRARNEEIFFFLVIRTATLKWIIRGALSSLLLSRSRFPSAVQSITQRTRKIISHKTYLFLSKTSKDAILIKSDGARSLDCFRQPLISLLPCSNLINCLN